MYLRITAQPIFLPPATKFGQGNIFRSVCQEFCPRGEGGRGGRAWQGECAWWVACVAGGVNSGGRGRAWQTVNERAVCILLECILVTTRK